MNLQTLSRPELIELAQACREWELRQEATVLEQSLIKFVEAAWPHFDPSPYEDHWVIRGMCEHLEAIQAGNIRRLLITIPPRCSKTNVVSICFPAWIWARQQKAFLSGPGVRFLCGSYNDDLSLTNANLSRRLIESQWYQDRWGSRFTLRIDQNTKSHFATSASGARFSSSVGGTLIGKGYDCAIIDDPHNTGKRAVESDADRKTVQNWVREILGTRKNSAKQSAVVGVMQRLHMDDMAGYILSGPGAKEWTHFMIPMRHDVSRHCVTVLKRDDAGKPAKAWQDPRKAEGEFMWEARFGEKEIKEAEIELGPAMASGRLQQAPEPAGGGIIKREWWKPWTSPNYPSFSLKLAVLDTAYTEKEENDPSALTIWGFFGDPVTGAPRVMLVYAWEGHKEFHDLLDTVAILCGAKSEDKTNGHSHLPSFSVSRLIIEDKAAGHSIGQEFDRVYGHLNAFPVELVNPAPWGDKVARVVAVQGLFAEGMIYAPGKMVDERFVPKSFAQKVIDQMAVFPHSKYKDLTDTSSMALLYMRSIGLLERSVEYASRQTEQSLYQKPQHLPYHI